MIMMRSSFALFALVALPCVASEPARLLGETDCRVVQADVQPTEKARWKGPCKDGYAHGSGILNRFLGLAEHGSFEGRLEQGKLAEGYEKLADGTQYEGQYQDGLRDGMGTMVSPTDDRYSGMWKAGKRHGKGKFTYGLGGGFEGEWRDGRPFGSGRLTFAGGRIVEQAEHATFGLPRTWPQTVERHEFKDGIEERVMGSRVKKALRPSSALPFDATYDVLTPAQQAYFRSAYALLHEDDEPPYPYDGWKHIMRTAREIHSQVGAEGKLHLRVSVNEIGLATAVTVFETPDKQLSDFMTRAMLIQRFKPARCGGKPCAMSFPYQLTFSIHHSLP